MKIIIPGGSGQVGSLLARRFHSLGHSVTVLSRAPAPALWKVVDWDGRTLGPWADELDGSDVVINLAGRSVNCRYTKGNRQQIKDSRIFSTRAIGDAIAGASRPPKLWLQASTATIYAHRFDAPNDEDSGILGGNEPNAPNTWKFSIDVATSWEKAANGAVTPNTRKVLMRSAIILSPDRDGIFDVLLRLVRFGLGGNVDGGKQYMSWVHDEDFARSIEWLIANEKIEGPVNIASPNPLPYADFMRILRKAWGIPVGLPATKWMLEIAAFFMRTESELVLKSRRVVPRRMQNAGFSHIFLHWEDAAKDLVRRWRED